MDLCILMLVLVRVLAEPLPDHVRSCGSLMSVTPRWRCSLAHLALGRRVQEATVYISESHTLTHSHRIVYWCRAHCAGRPRAARSCVAGRRTAVVGFAAQMLQGKESGVEAAAAAALVQ